MEAARFEWRGREPWLVLTGEIDTKVKAALTDAMIAEFRSDAPVSVDASGVTFIDSSGLALLVRVYNVCGSARLVEASPCVTKLLRVTGLDRLFG